MPTDPTPTVPAATDHEALPTAAEPGPLPAGVAAALDRAVTTPDAGTERRVDAAGYAWRAIEWGRPGDPPVLLVHGVTSCAETFWRVGPAIAAAGRHVTAIDLPGHGLTGGWRGRHRFAETAEDIAALVRAAGLDRPDLAVLGHSWGGMVAAGLPIAGLRPRRLVLLDPPALPLEALEAMTHDPLELPYATLDEAIAAVRATDPGWVDGDVDAKALGLIRFDVPAVLAILLENGDWDGGLGALADPAARGVTAWMVRGDPTNGGMIPDEVVPLCEARLGRHRVITIVGAPHSPQRTHPEATVRAILRAID